MTASVLHPLVQLAGVLPYAAALSLVGLGMWGATAAFYWLRGAWTRVRAAWALVAVVGLVVGSFGLAYALQHEPAPAQSASLTAPAR